MAQDSAGEKTEEPTQRKRQEAADEGKIPRSAELGTAAIFLAAAASVNAVAPGTTSRLMELFGSGLRHIGDSASSPGASLELLLSTGREALVVIGLLTAGLMAASAAIGALQGRGTFTFKPLEPQWERLNPISNAGRLLGLRSIAEVVKSLLKVTIIGWAVWHVLSAAWPDLTGRSGRDEMTLLSTMRRYVVQLLATSGYAYVGLAAADYGFQLWQHGKNLRMSKDEVRREMKQMDGDPLLKSRMRSIARSRIRRQMFKDVATADVVIVNPTHRAVALRYDPLLAPAPIVLAMGQRLIAERIKQLAYENDVPVVENKPLARALLASAQVGMMIPADLYAAVAEVLAFVIRERERNGAQSPYQRRISA